MLQIYNIFLIYKLNHHYFSPFKECPYKNKKVAVFPDGHFTILFFPFRRGTKNVERLLSTPRFFIFTSHPLGRGRGWALKWSVAHAARSGDSGQCCRECCNGDAHNDLPQTLLFFHLFNLQFDNLQFTIYLQFYLFGTQRHRDSSTSEVWRCNQRIN